MVPWPQRSASPCPVDGGLLSRLRWFRSTYEESQRPFRSLRESHDVARNRILKDERSQTRRLLLRFPEDEELSNAVFSPKSSDGEIELEVVPFKREFSIGPLNKFTTSGAQVSWKIAVIGTEARETKAPGNKGATKLMEKLSSMSIT